MKFLLVLQHILVIVGLISAHIIHDLPEFSGGENVSNIHSDHIGNPSFVSADLGLTLALLTSTFVNGLGGVTSWLV